MKKFTLLFSLGLSIAFARAQLSPENVMQGFDEKGFIENKGQVKDADGRTNNNVKFIYSRGIFNLELKQKGFSYELFQVVQDNASMNEAGQWQKDEEHDNPPMRLAGSSRIDITLEGANPKAIITAADPTGAYFNFYHSPVTTNRIEQVKAFNTITYQNIYPGIDLVFRAPDSEEQTGLQYDFIVHPGADPSLIRLKYNGTSNMALNADGSLQLNNTLGYVKEGKPVSFLKSKNEEVITSYVINKNQITYSLANYDRNQTLIIDPTLLWGTYYGGEDVDDVAKIALDSKKRPLVTGNTVSIANIATAGAYQTTNGGGEADMYVAKFKNNGKLDWASYFGGDDQDLSYGIIADPSDKIIVIGKAKSDGLATIGQLIQNGVGDALIVKFSPSGIFQWSTYKGGVEDEHFRNLKCDSEGFLYLGGYTESAEDIVTSNAYQTTYGGNGDCMIAKFSPSGSIVWCTYFGAKKSDRFHAINLNLSGQLLLLQGTTESDSGLATAGANQETFGGGVEDVLLAVFDTSGHRIWCTYYGGEHSDRGRGVESDSSGNIYICGLTDSENGIATPGAYQEHWTEGYYSGGARAEDGYLAKFTPSGQLIWGTYFGGDNYDRIWGMTIDRQAHFIYGAGGTKSKTSIATPGAWQTAFGGGAGGDGFFLKCDYDGNIIWSSYLGAKITSSGDNNDHLEDVKVDKDGFLYLVGATDNSLMPSSPGVHQTESNGGESEAVVYKFYPGFDCYDYNEPNEKFDNAVLVTSWSSSSTAIYGYNGSIKNAKDKDWFRIKIKATAPNLMIILSDLTHNYDLKFFNAQQVLLQTSANSGTTPDTIVYNNLAPATYYYRVIHANTEFDSLNCYRLTNYSSSSIFGLSPGVNRFSDPGMQSLELKVFPNPAGQHLAFNINSSTLENAKLTIYDMAARIVKTEAVTLEQGFQSIDFPVAELPSGTYTLVLTTKEKNYVASFVKQSE